MRKIIIASAVLMSFGCLQVAAQLNGSGYYRGSYWLVYFELALGRINYET